METNYKLKSEVINYLLKQIAIKDNLIADLQKKLPHDN